MEKNKKAKAFYISIRDADAGELISAEPRYKINLDMSELDSIGLPFGELSEVAFLTAAFDILKQRLYAAAKASPADESWNADFCRFLSYYFSQEVKQLNEWTDTTVSKLESEYEETPAEI